MLSDNFVRYFHVVTQPLPFTDRDEEQMEVVWELLTPEEKALGNEVGFDLNMLDDPHGNFFNVKNRYTFAEVKASSEPLETLRLMRDCRALSHALRTKMILECWHALVPSKTLDRESSRAYVLGGT